MSTNPRATKVGFSKRYYPENVPGLVPSYPSSTLGMDLSGMHHGLGRRNYRAPPMLM
jgi:hypothetical protein